MNFSTPKLILHLMRSSRLSPVLATVPYPWLSSSMALGRLSIHLSLCQRDLSVPSPRSIVAGPSFILSVLNASQRVVADQQHPSCEVDMRGCMPPTLPGNKFPSSRIHRDAGAPS